MKSKEVLQTMQTKTNPIPGAQASSTSSLGIAESKLKK